MKTTKKFFSSLLTILLFSVGMISAQVDKTFFDVYNAKSQGWSGGAYGSGSGTNYSFSVRFKKDVSIRIDTVWFGDEPHYLNCIKQAGSLLEISVQKGDSILYTGSIYYPGERDKIYGLDLESEKKVITKNPCPDVKCSALIQFRVNGKKYYYPVKNIEGLPSTECP